MAPPNNASCISDLNLNTASCFGSSYLTEDLRPATLDNAVEMASSKKRKSGPEIQNNNKSVKRMRKSKKDIQMTIQMEIEEVNALEKENKALEDEEMKDIDKLIDEAKASPPKSEPETPAARTAQSDSGGRGDQYKTPSRFRRYPQFRLFRCS